MAAGFTGRTGAKPRAVVAARSGRVAVAADRGKLGTAAPFSVIALAACDQLCIEAGTDPGTRARLAEAGPAIIEVDV